MRLKMIWRTEVSRNSKTIPMKEVEVIVWERITLKESISQDMKDQEKVQEKWETGEITAKRNIFMDHKEEKDIPNGQKEIWRKEIGIWIEMKENNCPRRSY